MNIIFVSKISVLNHFKRLAGDTAIYGMSSILGRILNWLLVPYYSFIFVPEIYGVVANLYAYVAFLLVLLLYGMETSFSGMPTSMIIRKLSIPLH